MYKEVEKMTNSKKMNPQKLKDTLLKYALYIILLLLLVVIVAIKPNFLSVGNLISILKQASTKGILAYGVAGIIILAGTDLSVGRVLGLCAAVAASLLQSVTFASRYYPSITEPLPLIVPFLACVAIAVVISAFNGFGMAKLHMHPFIVTLGTQLISYGLCCIYIENQPSGSTQALSSLDQRYLALATGSVDIFGFKLPYLVIIFLLLGVLTWLVWNKTRFGKNMFAVGGNAEAAEVSGVSVTKTIMGVFLYAGRMYGIASFLEGARIQSVGTATGINYELDAIAGCVIGGVSFMLYGMISAIGIRNVVENKVDFTQSRNLIIAAVILVSALGFNSIGGLTIKITEALSINLSGLAIAAIAGILLNAIIPGNDYQFGGEHSPDHEAIVFDE